MNPAGSSWRSKASCAWASWASAVACCRKNAYTRPSTPLIHSYSSALVNLVARNSATACGVVHAEARPGPLLDGQLLLVLGEQDLLVADLDVLARDAALQLPLLLAPLVGGHGLRDLADGVDPVGSYYIFALLFVMFDVEAVFIFPFATRAEAYGWFGVVEMAIFIVILALGLLYAWKKKVLRWV